MNLRRLKRIWKIITFLARIINTIEDVWADIKATFFDSEDSENGEKK